MNENDEILNKFWKSEDLSPDIIRKAVIDLTIDALKKNPHQSLDHLTTSEMLEIAKLYNELKL